MLAHVEQTRLQKSRHQTQDVLLKMRGHVICTSGGLLVAARSQLVSVIQVEGGEVHGIQGNEGGITQRNINCTGALLIFACTSGTSEGWTARSGPSILKAGR